MRFARVPKRVRSAFWLVSAVAALWVLTSAIRPAVAALEPGQTATAPARLGSVTRQDDPATPPAEPLRDKHPKLDSHLAALARVERERGTAAAAGEARARGLDTVGDRVRVVVEGRDGNRQGPRTAVAAVAGPIEAE